MSSPGAHEPFRASQGGCGEPARNCTARLAPTRCPRCLIRTGEPPGDGTAAARSPEAAAPAASAAALPPPPAAAPPPAEEGEADAIDEWVSGEEDEDVDEDEQDEFEDWLDHGVLGWRLGRWGVEAGSSTAAAVGGRRADQRAFATAVDIMLHWRFLAPACRHGG